MRPNPDTLADATRGERRTDRPNRADRRMPRRLPGQPVVHHPGFSVNSALQFPRLRPRLFLGLALLLWGLSYVALAPSAASVVALLPLERGTRLAESLQFARSNLLR